MIFFTLAFNQKWLVLLLALMALALAVFYPLLKLSFLGNIFPGKRWHCYKDFTANEKVVCRPLCSKGQFSLPGMSSCHPWLTCDDFFNIIPQKLLVKSVVKKVIQAKWKSYVVVMSSLSSSHYQEDFKHHLKMLQSWSGNPLIIQLLGFCNDTIITEFYKLGSALNVWSLMNNQMKKYDSLINRLNLCISYINIIKFLHLSPNGTRVMCDSNSLEKTLSQFLLQPDLHLVLNDLDALPEVKPESGKKIKCGHTELVGEFVAPEQRWPYPDLLFDDNEMPGYDEKTDIWKVPSVCNWFLENDNSEFLKLKLFKIHKQCKHLNASLRPTAEEVSQEYERVLQELL
ncbi:protein O-mannose kinase-like isoform X1 [Tachypleus tridentatus]|uniref:protein O-mannose kinase-like isoform X1 n=1 Tax=Tachypleus tridentatus TaxID=6853 RepID=UPI003FD07984